MLNIFLGLKAEEDVILLRLENPKILVRDDAEVVRDLVAEAHPFFGNGFTQEREDRVGASNRLRDGPPAIWRGESRARSTEGDLQPGVMLRML